MSAPPEPHKPPLCGLPAGGAAAGERGRGGSEQEPPPSPPASFSPSPPPSAVLKENKHRQNLPFTVPVRRAGRTKGHCCCTNRGSPDGPSTKAACVPPAGSGAEGLLGFWEGAGGDVVLNKVSVWPLAAPRAAPELPLSGSSSHPEDLQPHITPAESPKRLQAMPEPPRSCGSCTPCCGSQHGEGTPWPGWLPLLAGRQKDFQPASRTDRQPTLPAPNPPMQSLRAPRARQAGGSQGFVPAAPAGTPGCSQSALGRNLRIRNLPQLSSEQGGRRGLGRDNPYAPRINGTPRGTGAPQGSPCC